MSEGESPDLQPMRLFTDMDTEFAHFQAEQDASFPDVPLSMADLNHSFDQALDASLTSMDGTEAPSAFEPRTSGGAKTKSCPAAPQKLRKRKLLCAPDSPSDETGFPAATPEKRAMFELSPMSLALPRLGGESQITTTTGDLNMSGFSAMSADVSHFHTYFDKLGRLGNGSFAEVYKVRSLHDTKLYAVKKLARAFRGSKDRDSALQEVEVMRQLSGHPHCVRIYNSWEEFDYLYMQVELCEGGSLKSYLDEHAVIPEQQLWSFLLDIVLGIKHVHDNQLIHLDVKPSNLLLTSDMSLKIADFGLTHKIGTWTDGKEGDASYLALELLAQDAELQVGPASDIFSIGITALEMANNIKLPSSGPLWRSLREGHGAVTAHYSAEFRDLVAAMMHPVPQLRPTAADLLTHPKMAELLQQRQPMEVSPAKGVHKFLMPLRSAIGSLGRWLNCWLAPGVQQMDNMSDAATTTTTSTTTTAAAIAAAMSTDTMMDMSTVSSALPVTTPMRLQPAMFNAALAAVIATPSGVSCTYTAERVSPLFASPPQKRQHPQTEEELFLESLAAPRNLLMDFESAAVELPGAM
eukprot:TRINITY_DN1556_c0_g2_i1.p1 TRINITY_DN1556_c0_g2~~TRINITY_DN1556_c0_g2_i1.p1  ORF type:complete len:579 (-),score=156.62 TRINITY_DN1556_c0_g2_i1:590-2326(-)